LFHFLVSYYYRFTTTVAIYFCLIHFNLRFVSNDFSMMVSPIQENFLFITGLVKVVTT